MAQTVPFWEGFAFALSFRTAKKWNKNKIYKKRTTRNNKLLDRKLDRDIHSPFNKDEYIFSEEQQLAAEP